MKPAYRIPGMSRRNFLSYLAAPAALAFITPACMISPQKEKPSSLVNHLTFVDRDGLGPRVDAPTVQNYFVPLHEEQPITAQLYEPEEVDNIKSILRAEFEREAISWDDSYELSFSYQHFGVPDDDTVQSARLLDYCKDAQEFMYARLDGLFAMEMTWQMLPRNRFQLEAQNSVFQGNVGRYTYYVLRAYVNDPILDDLPSLINAQPLNRAIHYIVGDEYSLPKRANLYVIPGKTSIVSPFSELLHLTFHAPSQNYAAELCKSLPEQEAQRNAINAGETINEATAIVLAREYVEKYGADEWMPTIDAMADNLNHRFNNLNGAISYINRNGLQKSMDIYLESPGRFMQQIVNV
ncbi:hypothetical protein [Kaarinaea lacus]